MRVGIGLPTTTPGGGGAELIDFARRAEEGPFTSLGVVDRPVYDSYDPLASLAAAAAVTQTLQLCTMIVIGPLRNTGVLAKQAASIDALSGGRLTLGLSIGARSEDYRAVGAEWRHRGKQLSEQLAVMRDTWEDVGRPGEPALWGQSYFALGDPEAGESYMRDYYAFTGAFAERIVAGLLTDATQVRDQVRGYEEAGCDELVLLPATSDPAELDRLADIVG